MENRDIPPGDGGKVNSTPKLDLGVKVIAIVIPAILTIITIYLGYHSSKQSTLLAEQNIYLRDQGNEQNLIRLADSRVLERQQEDYFAIKDSLNQIKRFAGLETYALGLSIADFTRTWKPIVAIGPDSLNSSLEVEDRLVSPARGWLLSYLLNNHCTESGCDLIACLVFGRGDFSYAEVYNQDFFELDLKGNSFKGDFSQFRNCKFQQCKLASQELPGALMEDLYINQCNFEGGKFRNSIWRGKTKIRNCNSGKFSFRSTDFRGAVFEEVFRDPVEGDTIFMDFVDFRNSDFSYSKMDGPICVRKCSFVNVTLTGVEWNSVRFEDCTFDNVKIIDSEGFRIVLSGGRMLNSEINRISVRELRLEDCIVSNNQFSSCNFPVFSMKGAMPRENDVEKVSFYSSAWK